MRDRQIIPMPSQSTPGAKYHLIQSNLPVFIGGSSYLVRKVWKDNFSNCHLLWNGTGIIASVLDRELNFIFEEGGRVEIPAKGYKMNQAWFFMDEDAFKSTLIQGFLMEELPNNLFEKVYSLHGVKCTK